MDSAGADEAARRTTITEPSGAPVADETAVTEPGPGVSAGARADGRPRQIGPYVVTGELGRGGMGVVYSARDTRLDRLVAIKVVRSVEDASPDELARFRIEARAVAALHHPNIVAVHDVGEDAGRPYLVMSLVEGPSLRARLEREGPLEPLGAARLVAALARAVGAAHARGVLHRDLKPSNVLLRTDGAPVLTDFGLAKQAHATDGPTATGAVLGTPAYMSPEQALAGDVGPASDVWGLGAVLYECLCGRPPFVGSSVLRVLDAVVREVPPRPDALRAELPATLADVVMRCLEKEPARRYPGALALADDLEAVAAGRSVTTVGTPVAPGPPVASDPPAAKALPVPPPRPPRRRALGVPLVAVAAVALGLWAGYVVTYPPTLVVPPDVVAMQATLSRRQELARLRQAVLATGTRTGPADPNTAMAAYWEAVAAARKGGDAQGLKDEGAALQRAAAPGDAWATDLLAAAHLEGELGLRKDLNQAKTLYLQAVLTRPAPIPQAWRRGPWIAESRLAEVAALRSLALPTLEFRAQGSVTAPETAAATEILADVAWDHGRSPDPARTRELLLRRVRLGLPDLERRLERLLVAQPDAEVLSLLFGLALEDDSGARREGLAILAAVFGREDGPVAPAAVATLLEGLEGLADVQGIVARRAIERAGPATLREPVGEVGLTVSRRGDGVQVRHVIPGLPAARAGLAPGDLITGFWFGSPPRDDAPLRPLGASPWDERVLRAVLLTVGRGTTLRLRIGRGEEGRLVDLTVDGPSQGHLVDHRELEDMKLLGFQLADRIVAVVVDGARAPVLDTKGLMPALKAVGAATPGVDSTFVVARGTALLAIRFRAPKALLRRPGDEPLADFPARLTASQPPGSGLLVEEAAAGLQVGDRIELARGPDGQRWPIRDYLDLADLLLPLHVGDELGVTLRRGEDVVEAKVKLVARSD